MAMNSLISDLVGKICQYLSLAEQIRLYLTSKTLYHLPVTKVGLDLSRQVTSYLGDFEAGLRWAVGIDHPELILYFCRLVGNEDQVQDIMISAAIRTGRSAQLRECWTSEMEFYYIREDVKAMLKTALQAKSLEEIGGYQEIIRFLNDEFYVDWEDFSSIVIKQIRPEEVESTSVPWTMFKLIVEVNFSDWTRDTYLYCAEEHGNTVLADYLIAKGAGDAKLEKRGLVGATKYAAKNRHDDFDRIFFYLDSGVEISNDVLHTTVEYSWLEGARFCLELKQDIDELKYALDMVARTGSVDMARLLVEYGAEVDRRVIQRARIHKHSELVNYLITQYPGDRIELYQSTALYPM